MPPKRAIPCYTCGPPNDGTKSPFYQQCQLQLNEKEDESNINMSDDESSTGSVEETNVEAEEITDLSNS